MRITPTLNVTASENPKLYWARIALLAILGCSAAPASNRSKDDVLNRVAALPESNPDRADTAQNYFTAGYQAYIANDIESAIRDFETAYQVFPDFALLHNIALVKLRTLGYLDLPIHTFQSSTAYKGPNDLSSMSSIELLVDQSYIETLGDYEFDLQQVERQNTAVTRALANSDQTKRAQALQMLREIKTQLEQVITMRREHIRKYYVEAQNGSRNSWISCDPILTSSGNQDPSSCRMAMVNQEQEQKLLEMVETFLSALERSNS